MWSSKAKSTESDGNYPHIVTISFANIKAVEASTVLSKDNVEILCHNPGCQHSAQRMTFFACKHAIALLLSRVAKPDTCKSLEELCEGVTTVPAEPAGDERKEDSGKFDYEYILAERKSSEEGKKEYLVKWAPTVGPQGGVRRHKYGGALDWVTIDDDQSSDEEMGSELDVIEMTGPQQREALMDTLMFLGLKREHAF